MLLDNIPMFHLLSGLLWMVHFPLAAAILGCSLVALICRLYGQLEREHHRFRLSEQLWQLLPGVKVCLLLLVTLIINLIALQNRYDALPLSSVFIGIVVGGVAAGLIFLQVAAYLFRRQFNDPLTYLIGVAGVAQFVGAYFLLLCGSGFLLTPETWSLVGEEPLLYLSWAGVASFAQFMTLAPTLAAGIILLLGRRGESPCDTYRRFTERCAVVVALPALLGFPFLLDFGLNTAPTLAWSWPLMILTAVLILMAAAIALPLIQPLLGGGPARVGWIAVIALSLFPVWVMHALTAQSAVLNVYTLDRTLLYQEEPFERLLTASKVAEETAPAPAVADEEPKIDLARGEEVLNNVCRACHAWDRRVVGPAYNDVMPKYVGQLDALKEYIRNPVKVNPDYPPMPNLGLSEPDIDAVSHYLLSQVNP